MTILEFVVVSAGFTGQPGYTTLYITNAGLKQTAIDNGATGVHDLLVDLAPAFPTAVTLQLQQEVKEIDETNGDLVSINSTTTVPTVVTGSGGASGPSPAGAVISWTTDGVHRGRIVRGRTFLVPLSTGAYQSDGTLLDVVRTSLATSATDYRTSSAYEAVIWARPKPPAGGGAGPVEAGAAFPIVSSNVPDKAAILRSRRD